MIFSIQNVINSIAKQLGEVFPGYPVKQSPSLDTDYPCFFVFPMPLSMSDELSGYQVRNIGFDIVFVQQRNQPDGNTELIRILESLDEHFDMLTYTDGLFSAPLHVLTREATIEDQELHYKITLKQRVSMPRVDTRMMTEELYVEVEAG